MLGQGSPITKLRAGRRRWAKMLAWAMVVAGAPCALGAEVDVRLRFAWGSGGQSPQRWHGKISVAAGSIERLQPLGIEPDEAAAVRLVENEIVVAPLVHRAFDGCDVSIRADETAVVSVSLQSLSAAEAKVIAVPLGQLADQQFRAALDELGSYLLVDRSPGDRLRVEIDREHLVFQPGETLKFTVQPDLLADETRAPLTIEARLYRIGSSEELWQTTKPFDAAATGPTPIELTVPDEEGAYRIRLTAVHRPVGIAGRLAPWDQGAELAARDVALVVIDPAQQLPRLTNEWKTLATIDPANSSWWQRIPQWTQFDKLPGFATPRPLGNVKPMLGETPLAGLVELPATAPAEESAWQAYLLPVSEVGEPHAIEIEVPRNRRQHLAVSVVEPDAAGRVHSFGRDWGVYGDDRSAVPTEGENGVEIHRIVFWPRTKSAALVVANRSHARAAHYGKIRLLQRSTVAAPTESEAQATASTAESTRLVAAYIGTPRFADSLGGLEELDAVSGLSVDSWRTFLTGANRLAQHLRAAGYNAAIISVAADGASLAPIEALGSSPRYDTGPLAATGADPLRKDVLEALLRVFDREGLRLIPAVQLSTPLPQLEALKHAASAGQSGMSWIAADGRTWAQQTTVESAVAPHYNILDPQVQAGVIAIADQLAARYGGHPSLGGLAIQLSGQGFGVLPGLAWGMDDETTARFAADVGVELPATGDDRFQQRASLLYGQHFAAWKRWRREQTTAFYAQLATRVMRDRPETPLILCTEELFNGNEVAERLRQAVGGRASLDEALDELGIDFEHLSTTGGVVLLRPRRMGAEETVDGRAVDVRINGAPEFDQVFINQPLAGELLYHATARLRLPSFDAQSPFGADRTYFLTQNSSSVAAGPASRQGLIAALAGRDFVMLAHGAELPPLADDAGHSEALRIFQELPAPGADVRTERRQPVTLRVYREAESTTVCLINESPWPVEVSLPIEGDGGLVWQQLGADPTASAKSTAMAPTGGTLPPGAQSWALTLPPYGLQARRFSSRHLRIGAFNPEMANEARGALEQRIAEIELRMQSLDVERPYSALQNPHFELDGAGGRLLGWQPRVGQFGAVDVAAEALPAAGHSLHLQSEDDLGVAVQSYPFPIPATGQLVVRVKARAGEMQADARLYARIEYQSGGVPRPPRYIDLGATRPLGAQWTECEFAVDDLPLASAGQMRVQFHLKGRGEAWVDDVRLYDLRFPSAQRVKLAKELFAAKTALEEGQLMDCRRVVEGYWPRRLVEQVPPVSLAAVPADVTPTPPTAEESQGLGGRLRGMVPRILK